MAITAEQARLHFSYDPETGVLTWKVPRASRVKVGDIAGSITGQRRREVRLYNETHGAHRVAWLIVHGWVPAYVEAKRQYHHFCTI